MKIVRGIIVFLIITISLTGVCLASDNDPADRANTASDIGLTQAEKDFIKGHPVIHLGVDPEFVPYEFFDTDGVYKGIAADYIDLICRKTGLQMDIAKGLTWSEAYEKAVEKDLDALPCISKTEERQRYFLFSDSYFTFQRVIFVRKDTNTINSFEDLYGKTVAVQSNSSHSSFLSSYGEINLSLYPTVEGALKAVSDGTEGSYVGNLATSSYLIQKLGITNLKYVPIETQQPESLYFAVRKDWPELVGIINKALASINEEEKIKIQNKWIGIQENADYTKIIQIAEMVGAAVLIILTVSVFWIIRLRKEVRQRKIAQEKFLAAKEEAEEANQIKSMFLARMSHEIRTPLNAIMGMSYLIKKTGVTPTQNIYLGKLTQAARNMLGIINDILDFSKIESGKIELERVSFNLDTVLQRVINIASAMVEEQGIEFHMDKSPEVPEFFFGDPAKTEQILVNLISNAVKFTKEGMVTLSVELASYNENIYNIEFSIRDTGIGMHPDQVKKLFLPFNQADPSIHRRFGGTGLGLAIVKNLVDLMGGEIKVESVLNEGSVFHILLPLEKDKSAETEKNKMAADCFSTIRALVIDKNENARLLLSNCLNSFGITAGIAGSEEEALSLIRESGEKGEQYNLLIVDHITPENGGVELIKSIRKYPQFREAPRSILMIPIGREDLYDSLETAGIDFGITKPIISSVLYNGIIEMFGITPPKAKEETGTKDTLTAPYPYNVLLVEDNQTNQFIAKSILEQAGLTVYKANNGEEGYLFIKENRAEIDIILMDIHMPVMDGYESSDLIREIDKEIPIVAMTADAIEGVEEKCRDHGMYEYVSKPFEPDQFIKTVLEVLQNKKSSGAKDGGRKETIEDNAPVLNKEDGLKRLGGDLNVFNMVLKEYYDENRSVSAELDEKIDKKDYAGAVSIVHKIKSSSGNIGAASLFEAASELQKALKEDSQADISKWHVIFRTRLIKLLSEIKDSID